MKITKKQMKGGLHEMKYKQIAMAVIGMMLILSTFSSLALVSAQEDDGDEKGDGSSESCEGQVLEVQEGDIENIMNIQIGIGKVDETNSEISADILAQDNSFSLKEGESTKIKVQGKTYLVELVSVSEDSIVTFTVTDDKGNKETKEIEEERVEYILGIPLGVIDSTANDGDIFWGNPFMTLSLQLSTEENSGGKIIVGEETYNVKLVSGTDNSATITVEVCNSGGGGGGGGSGGGERPFFDGEGFTLTADEGKGYIVDLYIIRDGETIKGSFYEFVNKYDKKMPLEGTIDKEGNTFFTVNNEDGFDYVFKGQIKEFDTEQSTDFLVLRGQIKYFENDEPWTLTAFSKERGDDTEEGVIEDVTCIFHDSETEQECYTATEEEQFSCEGIESCLVTVSGEEETKLEWKSTCGGYAYTLMDGKNEKAEFYCGGELPLPREKKVVFESRVDEVKTLTPEMKFPTTDIGRNPTLTSSGEFDSQTSDKEITVTPKRIESQRAFFGIVPKSFWGNDEKRAVVEFNDGEKISTVTINEGEAKQVEGYLIEVGDIDSEGKIPIAVSSVIGK